MPIKIVCSNCGYVFYDDNNIPAIDTIIEKYKGKCPKCNHKLSPHPMRVSIAPTKTRRILK